MSRTVIRDAFHVCLVSSITFYLADLFRPGLVTNYFNPQVLLVLTAVFGLISILASENGYEPRPRIKNAILAVLLGLVAGLASYVLAVPLLDLASWVGIVGAVSVATGSFFVLSSR